jgi:hypothetical protein
MAARGLLRQSERSRPTHVSRQVPMDLVHPLVKSFIWAAGLTEVKWALIWHYSHTPSSVTEAARALNLSPATVSRNTRALVAEGVIRAVRTGSGSAGSTFIANNERVAQLRSNILRDMMSVFSSDDPTADGTDPERR